MARMAALKIQRGDRVLVRGEWREVRVVRSGRYETGGPVLILVFESGRSLRVHPGQALHVDRGGKRVR